MQTQSPCALLVGLEPDLASELEQTLARLGHAASRSELEQVPTLARRLDVIFCSDQRSNVNSLVALLRSLRTPIRVIVASRNADEAAWLEALEAGADDYCSTPFETAQIGWALQAAHPAASRCM
jgi:DNA-binding NarL/FixJ family response regulator